ncbi:MAG: hypothetical protein AAB923_04000, partial [Patescibacteria group bacterium]
GRVFTPENVLSAIQNEVESPEARASGRPKTIIVELSSTIMERLSALPADRFLPAAEEMLAIPDREHRIEALEYLTSIYAVQKLDPRGHGDVIEECHALPAEFRQACVNGFAEGLMEHGPPGEEYLLALGFCRGPGLSAGEASACERDVAAFLPERYSEQELEAACAQVGAVYRELCDY